MSRVRAIVVIGAIGGALTVPVWAARAARQRGESPDGAARDYVATGCLSAEAPRGTFVITDSRAKTLRYRLEGDRALLELHVGHTVEVSGTISKGESAQLPTLNVKSLIYISSSCSS
jgi:hypothetical protein